MSAGESRRLFRFGLFEADLDNTQLTRKGVRVRLQEQPFRILAMLLEHSGQIVTREDLRQELWPAGTYVSFDASLNMALKRLRSALGDDADNPRFIETIPKRGYRFIVPVSLEGAREPSTEQSVAAVATSSSAMLTAARAGDLGRARVALLNRRSILAIAAIAGAISLAAFFAFHRRQQRSAFANSKPVDIGLLGRSVAVLGFQNASGRPSDSWLATALAEMLRTELGAGGKLRVVPGENVAQFRAGAPWLQTDSLTRRTASRVGKALDSDLLVLGSFATVGDQQNGSVRVDFRLQDAQTGEILYEGAESGDERQLFGLVATVGSDLRERLGLPMIHESEEAGVVSSLPSDPDANRLYSLGLQKLRDADFAAAKDLFLQAEKLSPRFPLVHLMLFRAWSGLGYDQKAKQEIRTAYELSSGLAEVDRLQVEGAYYGSIPERDKAISAYRALCALYPDSVDYAEQLVIALNAAGRHEEALAVIHNLRKLPSPAGEDPRIDFWEGQLVAESQGTTAAQPFFEKAVASAASQGQELLYAHFRLTQCLNIVYGDHPQGATKLCEEAYNTFMAAGNRMYAADALRTMGDRRGAEGDLDGARELYQRAVDLLVPLGEHEKMGIVLNNMAIGYENQGHIAEAEKLFRQAADTWTECGDLEHAGAALGNLGDTLMLQGQLHQAELQYRRAQKQIEVSSPNGIAYLLYSIANLHLYGGDVAEANRLASQALQMARRMNATNDIAADLEVIGTIQISSGDLPGAGASFRQALAIFQQRGAKVSIAEANADLAEVSLEQGRLSDAEQQLRKSLSQFRARESLLDEVQSETDLSRVLLREGKLAEARRTISDAIALTADNNYPGLKLPAEIVDARIEAAEISARADAKSKPGFSSPRRKLQNALAAAHRLGYYQIECEARLALGELDLRENASGARTQLAELARNARAHGLTLVARRAATLTDFAASPKGRVPDLP